MTLTIIRKVDRKKSRARLAAARKRDAAASRRAKKLGFIGDVPFDVIET